MSASVPYQANLFADLADPGNAYWERTESDIQREWSKSGSAAMDMLLKRGQQAMEEGALGLSTSLLMPPSSLVTTEQLIELAKAGSNDISSRLCRS